MKVASIFDAIVIPVPNPYTDTLGICYDPDYPYIGVTYSVNAHGGETSTGYVTEVWVVAAPEPGTLALLCVGLAGMGFTRRMKKIQLAVSG